MRIQYISDIHLEIHKTPPKGFDELLVPVAPVLALLGDIGDPESPLYEAFFTWASFHWKQILLVPGNHEFWRIKPGSKKTIESTLFLLRKLEQKFPNVCLMWRTKLVSEDGVVILGCPLWSRPAEGLLPHESEKAYVDRDNSFDSRTLTQLHETDLRWLKQELKQIRENQPVVVLSHYAPTLLLVNRDNVSDAESTLYASDLDILLRPPVVAWACGHVHRVVQWTKSWSTATGQSGSILIVTNPRGYPNQETNWRRDAVLRIDPDAYLQVNDSELAEYHD